MGIRYERDNRKATNGPMIFFSIYRDEAFEEEIRGAFLSGLSFYAYKFPNDNMLCYGSSEGFIEGMGTPGFVIGMFSPDLPIFTIPYKGANRDSQKGSYYTMPDASTSEAEYVNEVKEIVAKLKNDNGGKIVAARVKITHKTIDIAEEFYNLSSRFPTAFVFCFSTPATGCWIGASPELLLESHDEKLHTMALAGTRQSGTQGEWDDKNIDEQQMVTDYILSTFKSNGLEPQAAAPVTLETGNIEHICTRIEAEAKELDTERLSSLLKQLSPTPALCGYPKESALSEIKRLENFERGCYGGFCGPFHSVHDFTLHVTLRCASVTEKKICAYAGAGITRFSNPQSEWEETNLKLRNIFPDF